MANLTISVDEHLLRQARIRAAQEGTSVNAVLRAELERYVEADSTVDRAWDGFLRLAKKSRVSSPRGHRDWKRADVQRFLT